MTEYGIGPGAALALVVKGFLVSLVSAGLGLYVADAVVGYGFAGDGLWAAYLRLSPLPMLLPLACGLGFMFTFALAPAKWGWVAVAVALLAPAGGAGWLAVGVAATQTTSLEVIAPRLGTVVYEAAAIATALVLCAIFARVLPAVGGLAPDDEARFHAPAPSFLVLLALFAKGIGAGGFAMVASMVIWSSGDVWAQQVAPPAAPSISGEEIEAARRAAQAAAEEAAPAPSISGAELIKLQPLKNLALPFVIGVGGMFAFALGGAAWQWLAAAIGYGLGPAWDLIAMALAGMQFPEATSIVVYAPGVALTMFNVFVITLTLLTCGAFAKRVPYVP